MIEIETNQALAAMCSEAAKQKYITFDTEFIREKTYFPILALLQVSWQDQNPILIDPLKITDWEPFHQILLNPDICKVFHAGRQDLEIFYYQMNALPKNLFDTQIAASMCGYGDQIGYSGLVSKILSVHLSKGSSYTNWLQRPLTDSQLNYARDDVRYLPGIYEFLIKKAGKRNRLEWIYQEIEEQLHPTLFDPNPDRLWRKVKRAGTLRPKDTIVLKALAGWRDETARRIDKPVRFLFSDEVLIDICRVDKLTRECLSTRRGVQPKFVDRHGDRILELHAQARKVPRAQWPRFKDDSYNSPSEKSQGMADLAWLLVKETARRADLSAANLVSKKELLQFVEAYVQKQADLSDFSITHGWRKNILCDHLIELLEGRLSIKIEKDAVVWTKNT